MKVDNLIVKMKFGSHLYGTDTPDSDLDFKGVFLPKVGELLLGPTFKGTYVKTISNNTNATDGKNTSSDVDEEFYSLHYFLKLALEGQTVALDMLHAPQSAILESSHLWKSLVEQRSRFHTKNLKAFIGYARRQAAKYGIKGSRLAEVRMVARFFEKSLNRMKWNEDLRLRDVWDHLPKGEHIHFHSGASEKQDSMSLRMYEVCGKKFQETASVNYVLPILVRFIAEYGVRAQQAAQNKGVDWKALSHAMRAAYQVKELFTKGTMTFPRPERKLLKAVKSGVMDFKVIQNELEETMKEVEALAVQSTLPERADRRFVEKFIHKAYGYSPDLDRGVFTDLSYDGG
jgi:hypothetical protein